jgi:2-hydroxychromene-2-carboxylate isomerase
MSGPSADAAPARQRIAFAFDFLSPYAYLAWTKIHGIAAAAEREVEPWPVLFAGLLDAHGTKGPAEIPAKRRYLVKDIVRIASAFGVPIAAPVAIPFRSLHALRMASLPMDAGTRRRVVDRLFAGAWARSEDLTDRAVLARIAEESGLGARAVEDAEAPENKDRLRKRTEEAVSLGVFGVPTTIADGEIFWGTDSLPHLERFLAHRDPVRAEIVEAFARVPIGAQRRT